MLTAHKLTYFFMILSLVLWLVTSYIGGTCKPLDLYRESGSYISGLSYKGAGGPPNTPLQDNLQWLNTSLSSRDLVQLVHSCQPVINDNAARLIENSLSIEIGIIGEINLNITLNGHIKSSFNDLLLKEKYFNQFHAIISSYISPPVAADKLLSITRTLKDAGLSLVSLANQGSVEHGMLAAVNNLETIGMRWLGLNLKQHEILRINDMRIGVIAYCGIHKHCGSDSNMDMYAPNKYSHKKAREALNEMKKHRVDHVIVIVHWGNEQSYFPDEGALYIARHLSELDGVSAIVGYHPQVPQGHAYFHNTLVIFSSGNFLIEDNSTTLCWERKSNGRWHYKEKDSCQAVHPALRYSLLEREQQARLYKLSFRKSQPIIAKYLTLSLKHHNQLRYSSAGGSNVDWITACGRKDDHCLACKPF